MMNVGTALNRPFCISLVFMLGLILTTSGFAQDQKKPTKLFKNPDEWNVTLAGPWREIKRNVRADKLYPAQLTYPGEDGQSITVDIEVAPRGITRRLRACDFPPLKVHFDKDKMKGTALRGNKSLKLVTYCKSSPKYEQYYIKEFLTYRIYNLITDFSFRVKPMQIEYVDNAGNDRTITRFGFFIEDIDDVAKRVDMEKLQIQEVSYRSLDDLQTSYFSLFQFMVGNLDWSATGGPKKDQCCHNGRLIGKGVDEIPKYVIPYDFDSTGLVNAHYAAPPDGIRVSNIRQRVYRGFCTLNDTMPQAVERFNQQKSAIIALFNDNAQLSDSNRSKAIKYLEKFYEIINDPKDFAKDITDKCRGEP